MHVHVCRNTFSYWLMRASVTDVCRWPKKCKIFMYSVYMYNVMYMYTMYICTCTCTCHCIYTYILYMYA